MEVAWTPVGELGTYGDFDLYFGFECTEFWFTDSEGSSGSSADSSDLGVLDLFVCTWSWDWTDGADFVWTS